MKVIEFPDRECLQGALLRVICTHIDKHDLSLEEVIGTMELVKLLMLKANTD